MLVDGLVVGREEVAGPVVGSEVYLDAVLGLDVVFGAGLGLAARHVLRCFAGQLLCLCCRVEREPFDDHIQQLCLTSGVSQLADLPAIQCALDGPGGDRAAACPQGSYGVRLPASWQVQGQETQCLIPECGSRRYVSSLATSAPSQAAQDATAGSTPTDSWQPMTVTRHAYWTQGSSSLLSPPRSPVRPSVRVN